MGITEKQKVISILSIDGGGIRGIIPASILVELENYLKEACKREDVRIADFFDIVAGTSTGALVAAMVVTPHDGGRPRPAADIVEFYEEKGCEIFSQEGTLSNQLKNWIDEASAKAPRYKRFMRNAGRGILGVVGKLIGAQYPSEPLQAEIKDVVGDIKLADITGNQVVIPTYDAEEHNLRLYTTRQAREQNSDVKFAEVVEASTAAPFFFTPKTVKADGKEFKLCDGGLAANNPTLLAMSEARNCFSNDDNHDDIDAYNPNYRFRILSIGTGRTKSPSGLGLTFGSLLEMILTPNFDGLPIIDMFANGCTNATEQCIASLLGRHASYPPHYLRIQEYNLDDRLASIDNYQNLQDLKAVAHKLLDQPVQAVNCKIGRLRTVPNPKDKTKNLLNKQALRLLAQQLALDKEPRTTDSLLLPIERSKFQIHP